MPRPPPDTSTIRPSICPMSTFPCPKCVCPWQPRQMHEGSKKAIIAALFANAGIAIAKFVGFLITRSAGLLAEAGHSLADSGNQALLLFGSKRGRRPADRAHPF